MESEVGKFYVYLHFTPDGDVFYVGKGGGGPRKRSHDFKNNRNKYYLNTVRKYGEHNIDVLVFGCSSEADALATEVRWIRALRAHGANLTNITEGGEGVTGLTFSKEAKRKMSAAAKVRGGGFARGHNPAPSVRAKMSASARGNSNAKGNKGIKGRKVPQETIDKRRKKLVGKKRSGVALANIRAAQKARRARERKEKEDECRSQRA